MMIFGNGVREMLMMFLLDFCFDTIVGNDGNIGRKSQEENEQYKVIL